MREARPRSSNAPETQPGSSLSEQLKCSEWASGRRAWRLRVTEDHTFAWWEPTQLKLRVLAHYGATTCHYEAGEEFLELQVEDMGGDRAKDAGAGAPEVLLYALSSAPFDSARKPIVAAELTSTGPTPLPPGLFARALEVQRTLKTATVQDSGEHEVQYAATARLLAYPREKGAAIVLLESRGAAYLYDVVEASIDEVSMLDLDGDGDLDLLVTTQEGRFLVLMQNGQVSRRVTLQRFDTDKTPC